MELNDKDMSITKEGFNNNVETVGAELSQQGGTLVNGSNYTTGIKLSGIYPNDIYINSARWSADASSTSSTLKTAASR